jgi:hypothetical protein
MHFDHFVAAKEVRHEEYLEFLGIIRGGKRKCLGGAAIADTMHAKGVVARRDSRKLEFAVLAGFDPHVGFRNRDLNLAKRFAAFGIFHRAADFRGNRGKRRKY